MMIMLCAPQSPIAAQSLNASRSNAKFIATENWPGVKNESRRAAAVLKRLPAFVGARFEYEKVTASAESPNYLDLSRLRRLRKIIALCLVNSELLMTTVFSVCSRVCYYYISCVSTGAHKEIADMCASNQKVKRLWSNWISDRIKCFVSMLLVHTLSHTTRRVNNYLRIKFIPQSKSHSCERIFKMNFCGQTKSAWDFWW
jgi:hypothetical protein